MDSTDEDRSRFAAVARALGDPKRLCVLESLAGGEASVGELATRVSCQVPNMSQHLAVLRSAGLVTTRHREPGEAVQPGAPVLTLLDPQDRWVRIYIREDQIGLVHLGLAAEIVSDTYPDRSYQGEVTFLSLIHI